MFERIIVPLDGSQTAEMVFPYLATIGLCFGSRIRLIRVCESNLMVSDCRRYLEAVAKRLESLSPNSQTKQLYNVEISVLLGSSNPSDSILTSARDMTSTLIITASRGASNQGRWPIGNVCAGILRSSDCPVLLVRKKVSDAVFANERLIKKILLPLDGSELSEAALPLAEKISQEMKAQIVLFRAVEPYERMRNMSSSNISGTVAQNEDANTTGKSVQPIVQYMRTVKQSLEKKGINTIEALQEGLAAEEIVAYTEANNIDLIVMSTHGHSGIGRWVFGSVTDRVLHAGDVPVLVVYP